jgi:Protein of unknown function (DUF1592)/Protein of unknown function (DUF1588)/Protein of unknown function (DUF1595)/Protein of unknown function (DUF1585)
MTTHRKILGALLLAGGWVLFSFLSACTGNIGDGATSGGSSSGSTPSGASMLDAFPCTSTTPSSGPTPLLLLARTQYLGTLQSLFGTVTPDLTSALGPDDSYQITDGEVAQFGLVQADIDLASVTNFQTAAELTAAAVVASPAALAAIDPCSSGTPKRTCAQRFVTTFGALAYRAPLTDAADIARHMALYDAGAATSDAHGIELVLRGMLQSPRFLYRVEIGTGQQAGPTAVPLSSYEVAARLSYVLWNTVPDAQLTQAAATGALATKEQVSAQLTRMLQDPKGQGLVSGFLAAMIQLPGLPSAVKDPSIYPAWTSTPTLPASMQGEAQAFIGDVLTRQGGTLSALLTSPTVFVNKDLGGYYGMSGGDDTFQSVTLPAGQASGLLTLPALLTLTSKPDEPWPIYRGEFVREVLLCQQLPSPPPNIPAPPAVATGVSVRQRLSEHETNPACSGCHDMMDPIGFGFSNYDGLGHVQTMDGNQPVDVQGNVEGAQATDIDGPFTGVAELATKLAGSTMVRQCIARQWFRYAMSRYEQAPDDCSMKSIDDAFQAANESLNALPTALVQSDAFLYRSVQ